MRLTWMTRGTLRALAVGLALAAGDVSQAQRPAPGAAPARPNTPSPARVLGQQEGERFWEFGTIPDHPMSAEERDGFQAAVSARMGRGPQFGFRYNRNLPLSFAEQHGYQEGRLSATQKILLTPFNAMSPAERRGFEAGLRQAITNGWSPVAK